MSEYMEWYNTTLKTLKKIQGKPEAAAPKDTIDLTDTARLKLNYWFGSDTKLYKCFVHTSYGKIRNKSGYNCTAAWSDGDSYITRLMVPGINTSNFKRNLEELGFKVKPGAKLLKRLKRSFLTRADHVTSYLDWRVVNVPEAITDGFSMANSAFLSEFMNEPVEHGQLFQYSFLSSRGLAKGTLIASKHLETDLVIMGEHQLKGEFLAPEGKQLLAIENKQNPKAARTDIQTLVNTNPELFGNYLADTLETLLSTAEPEKAAELFWEDFGNHDWYEMYQQLGKSTHEYRPRLSSAFNMRIDPRVSARLIRDTWDWQRKLAPIERLKVPVANSCRAYVLPDMSQFCLVTGEFKPNNKGLKPNQVAFPTGTPLGEVAVVRQPNAYGESHVYENVVAPCQLDCVQISIDDIHNTDILARHGGMDFDDSLLGFFDPEWIQAVRNVHAKMNELEIPRINLEKFIDSSILKDAQFNLDGILNIALSAENSLGAVVNFLMTLTLTNQWDFYRLAAKAENHYQMQQVQELYLSKNPIYPASFGYKDINTYSPDCRVPVLSFESEFTKFSYYKVSTVVTPACKLIAQAGVEMDNLVEHVTRSRRPEQTQFIGSSVGRNFVADNVTCNIGYEIGVALIAIWSKIVVGKDTDYKGDFAFLVDQYRVVSVEDNVSATDKLKELGVVANMLFAGRSLETKISATAVFATHLLTPKKRWQGVEGNRRPVICSGTDMWLFVPNRDENYNIVPEPGLEECWLMILQQFCIQQGL